MSLKSVIPPRMVSPTGYPGRKIDPVTSYLASELLLRKSPLVLPVQPRSLVALQLATPFLRCRPATLPVVVDDDAGKQAVLRFAVKRLFCHSLVVSSYLDF